MIQYREVQQKAATLLKDKIDRQEGALAFAITQAMMKKTSAIYCNEEHILEELLKRLDKAFSASIKSAPHTEPYLLVSWEN